jgi:hypothetical protein
MSMMAGEVTVLIVMVTSRPDPPSSRVDYLVRNDSAAPVWLVDDGWLIWRRNGTRIELSFARGRMRPGAQVYGYFPPAVASLPPATHLARGVDLSWPLELDRLWNAERFAAPPPGDYQLTIRIGYGDTPAPDAPSVGEGVELSMLRWQREAVSGPTTITVPRYGS